MAWCRFRCFAFAFSSTWLQTAAGNRMERTTVFRLFPLPGWPRRRRMAPGLSSGISQSASREGPPRSPAPANAFRRTGRKRSKSTSPASGSVVFVVCFFMLRSLSRADDANAFGGHLGMHNVQKAVLPRVPDEDETRVVQGVGVVRAQFVFEGSRRLLERDPVLSLVCGCLPRIPGEPHAAIVLQ